MIINLSNLQGLIKPLWITGLYKERGEEAGIPPPENCRII